MADYDPTIGVLAAEFVLHGGRPQHRPTYDTGRKAIDGTGADASVRRTTVPSDVGPPTTKFVATKTADGWTVTFEER